MKKTLLTTLALTAALVCLTGCGRQGPTPKPDESVRGAAQIGIPDDPVTEVSEDGTPVQPAADNPDAYAERQTFSVFDLVLAALLTKILVLQTGF